MGETPANHKVALVTGGGRNIGREIALALADAGIAIAVNVRSSVNEGQAVVDEIKRRNGEAMLCVADVADRNAVERMVGQIQAQWGRLDILVNNAAIRQEAPLDQIAVAEWRSTLSVILDGAFFCTQAALSMLRQSTQGTIINIGGLTGHTGAANRIHVVTAKAGLAGMTRALAHDLSPDGITVNCVSPGMIATDRSKAATPTPHHHASHRPLLGRRGAAQEVADSVAWLASDTARFITGQVIHVNGGAYLGG